MYRTSSHTVLNKVHILQVCVKGRDIHNRLKLKHEVGLDASSVGLVVEPTHLYRTKALGVDSSWAEVGLPASSKGQVGPLSTTSKPR